MPISADLDTQLDKNWENKSLSEVLRAPVSALAGVTDDDGKLLNQALNVKTISDLGTNKYFRAAYALTLLSDTGGK
ncbi:MULTISPECIES: hypothetical protein [unclassified Frankia]|uniref:hypothetical protein n=1 Tax=unclassified Frankia TaxID=2632575 RepID=UPI002AD3A778|nr:MULTISPECIES: hypothetical protein [unclassified Frankia]